jgi:hypothetical protein
MNVQPSAGEGLDAIAVQAPAILIAEYLVCDRREQLCRMMFTPRQNRLSNPASLFVLRGRQ